MLIFAHGYRLNQRVRCIMRPLQYIYQSGSAWFDLAQQGKLGYPFEGVSQINDMLPAVRDSQNGTGLNGSVMTVR